MAEILNPVPPFPSKGATSVPSVTEAQLKNLTLCVSLPKHKWSKEEECVPLGSHFLSPGEGIHSLHKESKHWVLEVCNLKQKVGEAGVLFLADRALLEDKTNWRQISLRVPPTKWDEVNYKIRSCDINQTVTCSYFSEQKREVQMIVKKVRGSEEFGGHTYQLLSVKWIFLAASVQEREKVSTKKRKLGKNLKKDRDLTKNGNKQKRIKPKSQKGDKKIKEKDKKKGIRKTPSEEESEDSGAQHVLYTLWADHVPQKQDLLSLDTLGAAGQPLNSKEREVLMSVLGYHEPEDPIWTSKDPKDAARRKMLEVLEDKSRDVDFAFYNGIGSFGGVSVVGSVMRARNS
jgi:hypothetical protein